jgi:NAD(P)-dependent dehydrogenase (short-subunit alcohol dehydrogenase family)
MKKALCALIGLFLILSLASITGAAAPQKQTQPVVLITGSNRGIGLAVAEEFAQRGWKVIATCRDPDNAVELKRFAATHPTVVVEALDVANDSAIDRLAEKYHDQAIDVLFNNAGVGGQVKEQQLSAIRSDTFEQFMRVNAYAPIRVSRAFLSNVAASQQKKVIAMTSAFASSSLAPQYRDLIFYSMSKAALNRGMKSLQAEIAPRGILVGLVSPGPVDTDMQRELRSGLAALGKADTRPALKPAESARTLVDFVEALNSDRAGHFLNYKGEEIPW